MQCGDINSHVRGRLLSTSVSVKKIDSHIRKTSQVCVVFIFYFFFIHIIIQKMERGKGKDKRQKPKNKLQMRVLTTPNPKRIKERGVVGNVSKH